MIQVDPSDSLPIWKQIENEIRRLVVLGGLERGAAVPSVRDMARDLRVNPATVSRAYQRLTDGGVLIVRRGEGTFVSDSPPRVRKSVLRGELTDAAARYARVAVTNGIAVDEALEAVEEAYEELSLEQTGDVNA